MLFFSLCPPGSSLYSTILRTRIKKNYAVFVIDCYKKGTPSVKLDGWPKRSMSLLSHDGCASCEDHPSCFWPSWLCHRAVACHRVLWVHFSMPPNQKFPCKSRKIRCSGNVMDCLHYICLFGCLVSATLSSWHISRNGQRIQTLIVLWADMPPQIFTE